MPLTISGKNHLRKLLCLISCLILAVIVFPDETYPQKVELDSTLQYIDPMEYAFMMHEDTRWQLKAGMMVMHDYTNQYPFKVSFEHRLAGSFTFDLALDNTHIEVPEYYTDLFPVHVSLDTRWYYRLNKRMRENGIARSMSDNYLAAGIGYTHVFDSGYDDWKVSDADYLAFSAKWGIQRRFLRYGYADLGINAGLMDAVSNRFKPSFVLNTYVEMGLCFAKDKMKLDREKLCPFLKCFEAQQFIVKSNLSNLISLGIFKDNKWINVSPNLAFEYKIGPSAFSLNSELIASAGYTEYLEENKEYYRYVLTGVSLEGRWYYNLKKSIRQGFSGNGLSANYLTAGAVYYKVFGENSEFSTQTGPQLYIAAGWQRLFSKHMYFDIQTGIDYFFEPNRFQNLFEPRLKFSLGYRF